MVPIEAMKSDSDCTICGEPKETRDHLFFACLFSYKVWTTLMAGLLGHRINPNWNLTLTHLKHNNLSKVDSQQSKMAFPSTLYWIWREHNSSRHQNPPNSAQS